MSAIIVSHLSSSKINKERLRSYFENARHGGGSVAYILHPLHNDQTCAYVAFTHQSVADNVLAIPIHTIDGKEIQVISSPRQMFGRISAEVDKKATYILRSNPELADALHNDLGVHVIVKNGVCILEGSLIQVESAHEYIADAMRVEEKQTSARLYTNVTESGLRRNMERLVLPADDNEMRSLPIMSSSRLSQKNGDKTDRSKGSIPHSSREKGRRSADDEVKDDERIPKGSLSRTHSGDPHVLGYIQKYRTEELIGIQRKYNVRCVISIKGTKTVSVTFVDEGQTKGEKEENDAADRRLASAESDFFDMYHTVLDRNQSKKVTFYDIVRYNPKIAADFKPRLEGLFRVLVEPEDEGSILITGRPGNVSQAEEFAMQTIGEQRNQIIQGSLLTPDTSPAPSRTLSPMSLQLPAPVSARTATASTVLNEPMSRGSSGGSMYNVHSGDNARPLFEVSAPREKPRQVDARRKPRPVDEGSVPAEHYYNRMSPVQYYGEPTPSLPSPYAPTSQSPYLSSTPQPKSYAREITPSVHGEPFPPTPTRTIVPVENYPASWQPYGQPVAVFEYPFSLKIRLFLADIFSFPVDVLVCSKRLEYGSAGPSYMENELFKHGGYEFNDDMQRELRNNPLEQVGDTITVTAGGQLRARYVVLTASPYLAEDFSNFEQVESQMNHTLREVFTHTNFNKARSMALPLLGTGYDNIPVDLFARSLHGVLKEMQSAKWTVKEIYIVTLHEEAITTVQTVLMNLLGLDKPMPVEPAKAPQQVVKSKEEASQKRSNRAWISHGVGDWTMGDDFEWIVKDFTMGKDSNTIAVEFVVGNIAAQPVEAIVNAANNHLELLGGTSGAILNAGGQQIQDDCRRYVETHGSLEVSQVISTKATGNLKCVYVIHTVGPIWEGDSSMRQCIRDLQDTFFNVLTYANNRLNITTLATPAISTGVYGVPTDVCMCAFYSALQKHVTSRASGSSLATVRLISLAVDEVETMATLFGELMMSKDGGGEVMAAMLGANSARSSKGKSKKPEPMAVDDEATGTTKVEKDAETQRQQLQLSRNDNRARWSSNANEWRTDSGRNTSVDETQKTTTGDTKATERRDGEAAAREPSDYVSLNTARRMLAAGDKTKCDLCLAPYASEDEKHALHVCGHSLCMTCWQDHCKHHMTCPVCGTSLGVVKGPQPHGSMTRAIDNSIRIPGYSDTAGAIVITYSVPAGEQEKEHPSPGSPYEGLTVKAYLPNNGEGRTLCGLLQNAFDARLTFTVGQSETKQGIVAWAEIPHKTKLQPVGPDFTRDSYPDGLYIQRAAHILQQLGVRSSSAASSRVQAE